MKTTEEIITEMEKLPAEEIRTIVRHFEPEEEYSEDVVRQLLKAREEAKQGINMSPVYRTKEEVQTHFDRIEKKITV